MNNILKNDVYCRFLKGEIRERVFLFDLKYDGKPAVNCKSKIDLVNDKSWLVDIKTTVSLDDMKKSMDKYRYDLQLSFYEESLKKNKIETKGVSIFAIEKTPPYHSRIFLISKKMLNRGKYGDNYFRGWKDLVKEMKFGESKETIYDEI